MFSITTKDRIKNMCMHRHLGVVRVGYKFKRDSFEMVWVKFRLITTLVRKSFSMQIDDPLWKRGRQKRTWMEVVKIHLKKCNLCEDLAQDRLEW